MNNIKLIKCNNKKDWLKATANNELNPGQTWEYSKFEELNTGTNIFLLQLKYFDQSLICPFHFQKEKKTYKIYALRGFSGFDKNLGSLEIKFLKNELDKINIKSIYFTSNPYKEKAPTLNKFSKFKSKVYFIDLTKEIDEIYNNFSTNLKRNIRKREKKNEINNSVGESISCKNLLSVYKKNLKRINLLSRQLYSFKSLKFLVRNKNNLIVQSKIDNEIVAVSIFILTKYNAYYLSHFANDKFNYLSSKHIFEAIKILKKKKIRLLNLGGPVIDRPGIEKFKLSFNPIIKNLVEYKL